MNVAPTAPAWTYRARLHKLVDGDTCTLDIDAGFNVTVTASVRLDGLDCPELHAPDPAPGRAARDHTAAWLAAAGPSAWPLLVVTRKGNATEKFGRLLSRIYRTTDGTCLNDSLLASGHARPYDGGAR